MPKPVQYWDLDFSNRARGSARALEDELVQRMRAAVRSRMVADVPLGAFLSGGVDSSAVVALMAEASKRAVKTCTIGFDEADHDERGYASEVAARFATDHRERVVAAECDVDGGAHARSGQRPDLAQFLLHVLGQRRDAQPGECARV